MREKLERVLNRVIVPMYDRLEHCKVTTMGMGEIYVITYYINDRIDFQLSQEIASETDSLFKMLNPSKHEDFIIRHKKIEDLGDDL